MKRQDRYDSLCQWWAHVYGLDWRRVKAQLLAESSMDPLAVSPKGALGLAQFLPETWDWLWRELVGSDPAQRDVFNPEHAIEACCIYMRHLYECYGEIPDETERYRMALAAYNAGRGNVNRMLAEARKACGAPDSYAEWETAGRKPGPWQEWSFASRFLSLVTGANAHETIQYVRRVMGS